MMNTTHGLTGLALASVTVRYHPEFATVAAICGIVGGIVPDLDVAFGIHRRTLHYPVIGTLASIPLLAWAASAPSALSVGVAFFVLGATVHAVMDAFGGGPELRPWRATDDRGVYLHLPGRWVRARRWIRYDGSPEDFALAAFVTLPVIALHTNGVRALAAVALGVSLVYTVYRKRMPDLTPEFLS